MYYRVQDAVVDTAGRVLAWGPLRALSAETAPTMRVDADDEWDLEEAAAFLAANGPGAMFVTAGDFTKDPRYHDLARRVRELLG